MHLLKNTLAVIAVLGLMAAPFTTTAEAHHGSSVETSLPTWKPNKRGKKAKKGKKKKKRGWIGKVTKKKILIMYKKFS